MDGRCESRETALSKKVVLTAFHGFDLLFHETMFSATSLCSPRPFRYCQNSKSSWSPFSLEDQPRPSFSVLIGIAILSAIVLYPTAPIRLRPEKPYPVKV